MELRPHQQTAFSAVQQAYEQGKRRALVVAPTGWGKTVLFAHVIAWEQGRQQQPVLVLAHRDELLQQAADKSGSRATRHVCMARTGRRDITHIVIYSANVSGSCSVFSNRCPYKVSCPSRETTPTSSVT